MTARTGVLILLVALTLTASWMLGYREGEQTGGFRLVHEMDGQYDRDKKGDMDEGRDMGRDQVCNEIRAYKVSIAKDLNDNTQICGWHDLDDPIKSN
jgi:hypothetical protein